MITVIVTIILTSSILLIVSFVLMYNGNHRKHRKHVADTNESLIKEYSYSSIEAKYDADAEKYRDEAENEYTNNTARYIDDGVDIPLLEQQILIAKDKSAERHLRLRASKYLKGFSSMSFLDDLKARLSEEEQLTFTETLSMTSEGENKPWDAELSNL